MEEFNRRNCIELCLSLEIHLLPVDEHVGVEIFTSDKFIKSLKKVDFSIGILICNLSLKLNWLDEIEFWIEVSSENVCNILEMVFNCTHKLRVFLFNGYSIHLSKIAEKLMSFRYIFYSFHWETCTYIFGMHCTKKNVQTVT